MSPPIQDTLLQLFEHVHNDPDSLPSVPIDEWDQGSTERKLLESFRDMSEQVHERIHQLKLADQQLREREEQYRSVFEASGDGLFVLDLDGFIVEANPAAYKQLGYTYKEIIGLHRNAIVSSDYHSLVPEYLRVIQMGDQFQGRAIDVRKDGSTFPVEVLGRAFTYKGQPHTLSVVRDITKQVEAERQLREREEQYRGIFESTYDGLAITTIDGFLVEVNPAFCRMFGYPYEEVIGLHASALTGPVSLPTLSDALEMFKAGRDTQTVVGQALHEDGTTFFTESYGTILTYQGKPHALSVVRDITERVQAERQLREREEQYRSVFEASTDALFIMDPEDGHIIEANPAACNMYGYSYEEFIGLSPSVFIHPDQLFTFRAEALPLTMTGGKRHIQGVNLRKNGSQFPIDLHQSVFIYQGKPHILSVIRDITEQVQAEQQLREREALYRGIFETTSDAIVIIDQEGHFVEVNPAICQMLGYTREELIGLHVSAFNAPASQNIITEGLETLKAGRLYSHSQPALAVRKDGSVIPYSAHGSPITYRGQPHSLLVGRDITEQVQAQQLLEQRVEKRTRELASLLEISHTVASTLQLKPLLNLILDQLKTVVDYTGTAITTLEDQDLVLIATRGPYPEEHLLHRRFSLAQFGPIWEEISRGETVIIDNVHSDSPLAQAYRETVDELLETTFNYVRAWMAVPLKLRDRVIGMLSLSHSQPDYYTQRSAELVMAIANQAAVAIENAQLYEQAQELAAVEERQRLARELHDSVSQALYGISLGVHTARMQLDRDPKDLAESLDYVLELAEAALIEMRALIFELRPESLETEGLVTALNKQAAALHARQNIEVNTDFCAEPDLPLKVKQELYRIAQEAMHNTVKHAHASKILLQLRQTRETVILEVCDNGRGFDVKASFPGHLGLHSMQERVLGLGGELHIESTPGQGTCIRVQVPWQ